VAALLPLLTQEAHAADDHTRIRFLKRHLDGLTLVAPLEAAAGGLQVLTQDWRVARKLVDDLASTEQEYIVEAGAVASAAADSLARLNQGLRWNGKLLAPAKVSWQNETRLRFALKAPQAGQISAICEQAGLTALSIKRIRIGRVPMAGLPLGQWRYLAGYQRF
ncbi:MAG TPA: RNA-binding protein, partial [Burkholderiaceae bacterium]|nr:RNA-binding protein [Burkholderiaceae bacterium]